MTSWSALLLRTSMQMKRDSRSDNPRVPRNSWPGRTEYQSSALSFPTSVSTDDSTGSGGSGGDRSAAEEATIDVETGAALEDVTATKEGLQQRRKPLPSHPEETPAADSSDDDDDDMPRRRSCSQPCCRGGVPGSSGPSPLQFRSIQPADQEEIKRLHELWFPVKYMDEFYDDLVYGRMTGTGDPLFTSVGYRIDAVDHRRTIAACVVGCFIQATSLSAKLRDTLIRNPYQHTKLFYIMTVGTTIQKQGIGTLLIQQCLEQVQQHPDCGAVYLHVLTSNAAAIQMYESLGFDRVQEIPNYYTTTDNLRRNCYLYAKYVHGNRGRRIILWQLLLSNWYALKRQVLYLATFVWTLSLLQPSISGMLSHRKRSEPARKENTEAHRDQ
jgi:histone acetyltransferase MCC1